METKKQELYQAPAVQAVEVNAETIICASDPTSTTGTRQDYGDPNPLVW